nr:hypothetical protein CFP56_12078 [Quercus suber]
MPSWHQPKRSDLDGQDVQLFSVQSSDSFDNKTHLVDTRHPAPDHYCSSNGDEPFRKAYCTAQCINSKQLCFTSSIGNEELSSRRLPIAERCLKREVLGCTWIVIIRLPDKHIRNLQYTSDDGLTQDIVLSTSEEEHSDGLANNYFAKNPLMSRLIPHTLDEAGYGPFDDFHSSTASTATSGTSTSDSNCLQERWNVDKDAAAYLSTILAFSGATNEEDLIVLAQTRYQDIKMDVPLLAYDPELELRHIRRRNVARLSTTGMSLYHLDTEADESIQWPKRYNSCQLNMDQQIANERLLIAKDAVELLNSILQPGTSRARDIEATFFREDKVTA